MNIIRGKIPSAQKVVIYGPEGIGKTSFAACFPDPLFIDTEGGTKHIDVARLPAPTSWTMLLEQVQEVKKENTSVCKTLVLDTAEMCIRDRIYSIFVKVSNNCRCKFGNKFYKTS